MSNFLDVADELRKQNKVDDATEEFNLVFKGIGALQSVHSKANVDLNNVESVFAAFEMAQLIGRLNTFDKNELKKLPNAMKRVIAKTIEKTILFPVANGKRVKPHQVHNNFMGLINKLCDNGGKNINNKVSIITFNYDLCLDYTLHFYNKKPNYCLNVNGSSHGIKLFKLHGSLNWGVCPNCNKIVSWDMEKFFNQFSWESHFLLEVEKVELDIGSKINEFVHCGSTPVNGPMLIPPTWNKMQHQGELENVWRAASNELSTAENIIVCGYSFPDTDMFFTYLYALGTVGETLLKKFWVFDPDVNVENKFRNLLGPGASGRFYSEPLTFNLASSAMINRLKLN